MIAMVFAHASNEDIVASQARMTVAWEIEVAIRTERRERLVKEINKKTSSSEDEKEEEKDLFFFGRKGDKKTPDGV